MGAAKRRSPSVMPEDTRAAAAGSGLQRPLVVAGARGPAGTRALPNPSYDIHGQFRLAGSVDLTAAAGKHVVILVHGYNVTASQSLEGANDFFTKLEAGLVRDHRTLSDFVYLCFTWPGDVGPVWFSDGQRFAQDSGVALYQLARELHEIHQAARITMFTHSLGAHVGLRSAAILGERLFMGKGRTRFDNVVLMAPAVENDVFERPGNIEEYHFPDAPFGMSTLHMIASRADDVLRSAFLVSEADRALGYAGPESMAPLQSMSRRVVEVLGPPNVFQFALHDFSPHSTSIMNPALHAHDHSDYWTRQEQVNYYVNMVQ